MKKDVWLTIRSRQHFAGCDEERVNLETAATLYERGGKYYIAYEESELTGLEGTKTTVKLDGKTVTLIRTGTFPSHMVCSEDERHIGLYQTPIGHDHRDPHLARQQHGRGKRRTAHHRLYGRGGQLADGRTSFRNGSFLNRKNGHL